MTAARLVSDVAAAAIGRWPDLLTAVGIDTPFNGKHGPCPACGGKDRFRFDKALLHNSKAGQQSLRRRFRSVDLLSYRHT